MRKFIFTLSVFASFSMTSSQELNDFEMNNKTAMQQQISYFGTEDFLATTLKSYGWKKVIRYKLIKGRVPRNTKEMQLESIWRRRSSRIAPD